MKNLLLNPDLFVAQNYPVYEIILFMFTVVSTTVTGLCVSIEL